MKTYGNWPSTSRPFAKPHASASQRGDWQTRFGAKRRAIDKAILAECEKQIIREDADAERDRIARAFGRPIEPTLN